MTPVLRLATLDDADQVQAIYAPYCFTPISFELEPPGVDEIRRRMAHVLEHYPWLVGEVNGRVVGYVYAGQYRTRAAYGWSVETTVYIHHDWRGRGLGRRLYWALLRVLALQGYVNAYAGTTLPNPASVALHEAVGFRLVGVYEHQGYKNGQWHDVAWYQRLLQSELSEPVPPRQLTEVMATSQWPPALAHSDSARRQ